MDDEQFINEYLTDKGKVRQTKMTEAVEYLKTRFPDMVDSFSLGEAVFRILNHLEERPSCPVCGSPCKYLFSRNQPYSKYCSKACADTKISDNMRKYHSTLNEEAKDVRRKKREMTCMERYGAKSNLQTEDFRNKSRQTCLERYGTPTSFESEVVRENWRRNNLEKYGVEHVAQRCDVREKISASHLKEETKRKMRSTCMERYGVEYISQLEEVKDRLFNTTNKHPQEDKLYDLLKTICPDIERQHKDDNYPYRCDFYVPSLKLYIEFQGSMYHFFRLYRGTEDDQRDLDTMREKKTRDGRSWKDMISPTWCEKDVEKLQCARANNLNFLSIYPKFHADWIYYATHSTKNKICEGMRPRILETLRDLIHNNDGRQTVVGEYFYDLR